MSMPPFGTVPFLFTDIEGSTQHWEKHPEAMKAALARHDAILKETITAGHGHINKIAGDGVHAVFETAFGAIHAVIFFQQNPSSIFPTQSSYTPIKVRTGIHTGEAEFRDGDYFEQALRLALR